MDKKVTYSQVGQDKWVLSLFPEGYKGFFLDIGCGDPKVINNTLLLEENGWEGIAIDVFDFSDKWKSRKVRFIQMDAIHAKDVCEEPKIIDYLSIDVDLIGLNYQVLKNLIEASYQFKVITIEHNLYLGEQYNMQERIPQRNLLLCKGYFLSYPDITDGINKFEDWWINTKWIHE